MEIVYQQLIDKSKPDINLLTVEIPYFVVPWHYHNEVEIIYIEKGHGERFVGDHSEMFHEGDIAIIGPKLPHVWRSAPEFKEGVKEQKVRALVIHFNDKIITGQLSNLPEMAPLTELLKQANQGIKFNGKTRLKLARHIKKYINARGLDKLTGLLSLLEIMALSEEKTYLASTGYSKIKGSSDFDRFNRVHQFMLENFRKTISLEQAAEIANMTPTSFCRYFKKRTTKSFLSFLNELRVGHACKLLMEKKLSVSGIAAECGFNNLSNFNYLFKKIKGMTPSQYIKTRQ